MKRFCLSLILALLPFGVHAQTFTADISGNSGSIVANGADLHAPLSKSFWLVNDLTGNMGDATGKISLKTGDILSGDYQDGATFDAGGFINISATSVYDSLTFSGVFTSASWSASRLANGTYSYTLAGNFSDPVSGQTGSFTLTTVTGSVANLKFSGAAKVQKVSIHLN